MSRNKRSVKKRDIIEDILNEHQEEFTKEFVDIYKNFEKNLDKNFDSRFKLKINKAIDQPIFQKNLKSEYPGEYELPSILKFSDEPLIKKTKNKKINESVSKSSKCEIKPLLNPRSKSVYPFNSTKIRKQCHNPSEKMLINLSEDYISKPTVISITSPPKKKYVIDNSIPINVAVKVPINNMEEPFSESEKDFIPKCIVDSPSITHDKIILPKLIPNEIIQESKIIQEPKIIPIEITQTISPQMSQKIAFKESQVSQESQESQISQESQKITLNETQEVPIKFDRNINSVICDDYTNNNADQNIDLQSDGCIYRESLNSTSENLSDIEIITSNMSDTKNNESDIKTSGVYNVISSNSMSESNNYGLQNSFSSGYSVEPSNKLINSSLKIIDDLKTETNPLIPKEKDYEWKELTVEDINTSFKVIGDLKEGAKLKVVDGSYLAEDKAYLSSFARYTGGQGRDRIMSFLDHLFNETKRNHEKLILEIRNDNDVDNKIPELRDLFSNMIIFLHRYDVMRNVYKSDTGTHAKLGVIRNKFFTFKESFFKDLCVPR
ncbi:hypothetical protein QJ850_gp441 [Acanthamoeba polyphaga mimivirus]|uniref:Uncharacterized protein n=1 Tax=Acanthamoeba polyphaga mimivirus Kroon TaxID=3069720 RepID=A0A0G2Y3B1_9VIRU|nr:hypothetical protein QJ850_gp441 [Acanthamoeba polyphaga mimivirus]AKI80258.1 hypothetical protein [Acanthamoeba polyphaga mimivirus Kroon]